MPRSEIVQARIRPELKREIELLKGPRGLSWQQLMEQLLETWVADQHRHGAAQPGLSCTEVSPSLARLLDPAAMAEVQTVLRAAVEQGAPIIVLQCPVPVTLLPTILADSPHGEAGGLAQPPEAPEPPAPSASVLIETLPTLQCHKCQHTWTPRRAGRPDFCPKCKNPHWWEPRRRVRQRQIPS